MDIRVNDVLLMKKAHPCGEKRWKVLRTGMDFRLRCLGCGHEVMLPRSKAEKISARWSGRILRRRLRRSAQRSGNILAGLSRWDRTTK